MVWRSLGDVLESALAKALESGGDAGAAAPAVSQNPVGKVGRPKPAQVDREVSQAAVTAKDGTASAEDIPRAPSTVDRRKATASKDGRPTHAVALRLYVVEGGRREARGEEETNLPASVLRSYGREHRARKLLKLVWVR